MTINLTRDQLVPIAESVKKDIDRSLSGTQGARRCLPAWISQPENIPNGAVCVAELGGTNLRVASIVFDAGKATFIDGPVKSAMPWKRGCEFSRDQFLGIIAGQINSLHGEPPSRLGYCFSFPTEPTPDRDARLIHWVKGINVPGMINQPVGESLLNYLRAHHNAPINSVSVINDAVSALFSGLTTTDHDAYIGLIVGTGANAATFVRHKYLLNASVPMMDREAKIPINLEMGNLPFIHLTKWDETVDRQSENPGIHLFEKAISGMYLGRIFKAMFPGSGFYAESGAKGLMEIIDAKSGFEGEHRTAAINIIIRSADLTAAALAGIIGLLYEQERIRSVCIASEGALYWSNGPNIQSYNQRVQATLKLLLPDIVSTDMRLTFPEIDHTTIIGTAIAALS
jgi:hexokinase